MGKKAYGNLGMLAQKEAPKPTLPPSPEALKAQKDEEAKIAKVQKELEKAKQKEAKAKAKELGVDANGNAYVPPAKSAKKDKKSNNVKLPDAPPAEPPPPTNLLDGPAEQYSGALPTAAEDPLTQWIVNGRKEDYGQSSQLIALPDEYACYNSSYNGRALPPLKHSIGQRMLAGKQAGVEEWQQKLRNVYSESILRRLGAVNVSEGPEVAQKLEVPAEERPPDHPWNRVETVPADAPSSTPANAGGGDDDFYKWIFNGKNDALQPQHVLRFPQINQKPQYT